MECFCVWAVLSVGLLASPAGDDVQAYRGAKELFFAAEKGGEDRLISVPASEFEGNRRPRAKDNRVPDRGLMRVELDEIGEASLSSDSRKAGLRHWIELVEEGSQVGRKVTSDRVFHTGERIRLHFQSNQDGYISLLQLSGAKSEVLFPAPGKGFFDGFISAHEDRVLPGQEAWFRFDHRTGIEKLVVVFSPELEPLERILPGREPRQEPREPLQPPRGPSRLAQLASLPPGAKGLVVESELDDPNLVGSYAVSLTGEPIVLEIQLVHQ